MSQDTTHDQLVRGAVDGAVATITLDSPHNRNALSHQLVTELAACLAEAEADPEVRVVVLESAGRVFCSGADLSEAAAGGGGAGGAGGVGGIVDVMRSIITMSKPVVARIAGPVRAGGIGLIAACDIVIASEEASFALTEVKLGLTPAVISMTVLPRMTSRAAAYTCLTGETFGGAAAAEMGLVTEAVAAEALDARVTEVCASLATGAPQGLRETKALLARDLVARIDADRDELAALSARLFGSDEAREAMTAFLSRKK